MNFHVSPVVASIRTLGNEEGNAPPAARLNLVSTWSQGASFTASSAKSGNGTSETNGDDARMSACRGNSGHRADSSKGPTLTRSRTRPPLTGCKDHPDYQSPIRYYACRSHTSNSQEADHEDHSHQRRAVSGNCQPSITGVRSRRRASFGPYFESSAHQRAARRSS